MVNSSNDSEEAIIKEAYRIEEDVLYSEKSNFVLGNYWGYCNYILGIIIIILSITAGGFAFSNLSGGLNILIGIVTIVITAVSIIQIFLNPCEKSRISHNVGIRYNKLRREIRIFYNTEVYILSTEESLQRLTKFTNDKTQLDSESPNIPGFIYNKAKKTIEREEHSYSVDN